MKQSLQEEISNQILEWREGETVHLLHFNFPAVPKKQGTRRGTRLNIRTKNFQEMIAEIAAETISHKSALKHLGARIIVLQHKRAGDLDNFVKSILDGLKQIAFGDDSAIDFVEVVRVRAEKPEDIGFVVEIVKQSPKRGSTWI